MKKFRSLTAAFSFGVLAFVAFNFAGSKLSHLFKTDQYFRNRSVKLVGERGMCSGQQVRAPSGKDYILTAAHCRPLADKDGVMKVRLENGNFLNRRVIEEDAVSDLLLIEGLPGLDGLDIADSDYQHEHVRTFTHGNNLEVYQTDGELIQLEEIEVPLFLIENPEQEASCSKYAKNEVIDIDLFIFRVKICALHVVEVVSTAKVVPGSSGGMIVDDKGNLVAIVSAGNANFSLFVPLKDIKNFLKSY